MNFSTTLKNKANVTLQSVEYKINPFLLQQQELNPDAMRNYLV